MSLRYTLYSLNMCATLDFGIAIHKAILRWLRAYVL